MITHCLDVDLHSRVPLLIDGFAFAIPGSSARMISWAIACFCGFKTFPWKKCTDRCGLWLISINFASLLHNRDLVDLDVEYLGSAKKNLRSCGQKRSSDFFCRVTLWSAPACGCKQRFLNTGCCSFWATKYKLTFWKQKFFGSVFKKGGGYPHPPLSEVVSFATQESLLPHKKNWGFCSCSCFFAWGFEKRWLSGEGLKYLIPAALVNWWYIIYNI